MHRLRQAWRGCAAGLLSAATAGQLARLMPWSQAFAEADHASSLLARPVLPALHHRHVPADDVAVGNGRWPTSAAHDTIACITRP